MTFPSEPSKLGLDLTRFENLNSRRSLFNTSDNDEFFDSDKLLPLYIRLLVVTCPTVVFWGTIAYLITTHVGKNAPHITQKPVPVVSSAHIPAKQSPPKVCALK